MVRLWAAEESVVTDPSERRRESRPILVLGTHISPFVRSLRFSATILPLMVMPLTTPFLPLTVPAYPATPQLATFVNGVNPAPHAESIPPPAPSSLPPTAAPTVLHRTASTAPAARSGVHSRRLTLSRFPLLRSKGSRELARSPSTSLHSKSGTPTPPTSPDSPFLATGAPRSSTSIARACDIAREPAAEDVHEVDVITEEAENFSRPATPSVPSKPDKMHQTSSRLLRMTDDERPYTRVSDLFRMLTDCVAAICRTVTNERIAFLVILQDDP